MDTSDESNKAIGSFNKTETALFVGAYSMVFFFSLIGNSLMLLIVLKKQRKTVNNLFLCNILISNSIYTLCAPFPFVIEISELKGEWIFLEFLCPILAFMNELSTNLNTLTMCVSSIERLIAITCPLKKKLPKKTCFILIALIWTISSILALPWVVLMKIEPLHISYDEDESIESQQETTEIIHVCVASYPHINTIQIYFLILNISQYVLPMLSLLISYSIITCKLRFQNSKALECDENKSNNIIRKKREIKLFKMHVFMIIFFNACWLPFQLYSFIFFLGKFDYIQIYGAKIMWIVSYLCAFLHFCLNPYLTGFLNENLRTEMTNLFFKRRRIVRSDLKRRNLSNNRSGSISTRFINEKNQRVIFNNQRRQKDISL